MNLLADVNFYEPWWIQILKVLVIFGVTFAILPITDDLRAQAPGPLPGPLRPQSRWPIRPDAAAGRDRQVRHQGALPPLHVGPYLYRIAPAISILTAVSALALVPFGNVQHIGGQRVGLYGIDVTVGPLYVFAFAGISFYGILLGGWASDPSTRSWGRCGAPPS